VDVDRSAVGSYTSAFAASNLPSQKLKTAFGEVSDPHYLPVTADIESLVAPLKSRT
jgi:hypothetical protein